MITDLKSLLVLLQLFVSLTNKKRQQTIFLVRCRLFAEDSILISSWHCMSFTYLLTYYLL